MGGTHIDGVVISDGKVVKSIKNTTDREDLFKTIWTILKELIKGIDKSEIKRIHLSTTVSTNAIVEDKISKVGMIVQSGPGINYSFENTGDIIGQISGYVDHRGKMVKDIDIGEIRGIKNNFLDEGIESCGIVTKFSTRNPSHEMRIRDEVMDDFKTNTMGHTMSGKLNFPRRVHTTYLNEAVNSTFKNFAENIKRSLKEEGINAPVYVLKADGGTMDLDTAIEKPVETILSGPAASFMGLSALLKGEGDGILLDIGGTTTDIFFLADEVPLFEPLGIKIKEHKTLVRALYSVSIGLGGDSYIRVESGKLKIGPERKGYPVAFGGEYATPTDAMVVLGKLEEGDKDKSEKVLSKIANELGLTVTQLAENILDQLADIIKDKVDELLKIINSKPVYTVKELLEDANIEPEFINIIGGPAKVLAPVLQDKFGIKTNYPSRYQVANAVGAALAKPTMEINMIADTDRKILSVPEVELYEPIDRSYNLEKAEKRAMEIVIDAAINLGADRENIDAEIVESNSFNMVKGFLGSSKNIRVRAQVKPGLIYELRSED